MKTRIALLTISVFFYLFSGGQPCNVPDSFFADDTLVVCNTSSCRLTAPSVAGASYRWSTAELTNSITINFNGKYWLEVDDGSCDKTDTITVLFNSFLLSPR